MNIRTRIFYTVVASLSILYFATSSPWASAGFGFDELDKRFGCNRSLSPKKSSGLGSPAPSSQQILRSLERLDPQFLQLNKGKVFVVLGGLSAGKTYFVRGFTSRLQTLAHPFAVATEGSRVDAFSETNIPFLISLQTGNAFSIGRFAFYHEATMELQRIEANASSIPLNSVFIVDTRAPHHTDPIDLRYLTDLMKKMIHLAQTTSWTMVLTLSPDELNMLSQPNPSFPAYAVLLNDLFVIQL